MQHTNDTRTSIEFNIFDGTFRRRATDKDKKERILERINKNTDALYREVIVKGLSGFLDSLSISKTPKGGDMFEITLSDGEDYYLIKLHPNGKEIERFCVTLPNIDLDKLIFLAPKKYVNENITKFSLLIEQDNKKVLPFNTLKEPNGLPMPAPEQYTENAKLNDEEYALLKARRVAFFKEQFLKYGDVLKNN